jgi:hypothetical protein
MEFNLGSSSLGGPFCACIWEAYFKAMSGTFGSGAHRTPRPLVETAQKVASPPHRGPAREEVELLLDGVPQTLAIVRQNRINGGTQAYWLCRCGAKRAHLYVLENELACRVCLRKEFGLDYRSRHIRHSAVLRVAKLRRKIGAPPGLLAPLPPRPRHWRKDYWDRTVHEITATEAVIAGMLHAIIPRVRRRLKRDRHSDRAAT